MLMIVFGILLLVVCAVLVFVLFLEIKYWYGILCVAVVFNKYLCKWGNVIKFGLKICNNVFLFKWLYVFFFVWILFVVE